MPLLFPACCCTVQIFALESAALPRALQPRLLAPGTEDGSCSDAKLCFLLKGNNRPRAGLMLWRCSVGIWDLPRSGVGRCCCSPWSLWAPAREPSASSPSSPPPQLGNHPGKGAAGLEGGSAPCPAAPRGAGSVGEAMWGAQGHWVSTPGLEPPKIQGHTLGIHLRWEEPWEGLGICFKVSEGNPSPFCAIFQPPFALRNALLAGRQQERALWWGPSMAGGLQGRNLGQGPLWQRFWLCPRSPALASAPPGAGPALGVWDTGLCFRE